MTPYELLKVKRVLLGVTQKNMTRELFYTQPRISQIEKGDIFCPESFNVYNSALDALIDKHPNADNFKRVLKILESAE